MRKVVSCKVVPADYVEAFRFLEVLHVGEDCSIPFDEAEDFLDSIREMGRG